MTKADFFQRALQCSGSAVAITILTVAASFFMLSSTVVQAQAVRPEIGKPLQAAQELMRASKFKEALAKVREAEAVSGRSAQENYLIDSMRGSAASGAGDNTTAMRSFEAVVASGKAPASSQLKMIEALVGLHYGARDYPTAIQWANRYFRDGGSGGQVRTLLIQSYFQSGDFANTAKESLADIQADQKAGRTPSEEKLQLLANAYLRQKNTSGYISTIEKLLNYYPKKSLWADVVSRLQNKPGFADRLSLDVYRLKFATGNLSTPGDYMEMAQLALQAGFPSEAKKIVDEGYTTGVLGKGTEADRQKRLRDLTEKQVAENQKVISSGKEEAEANAARTGDALVTLGYNLVTGGQAAKGIPMIEAGIKKGNLKRPEDAKLLLGIAQIQAGQKAKGMQTLKTVQGTDGTNDLANLWVIFAQKQGAA
jgi:tetratricopeptide (TPR) repeat protein